MAVDVAKAREIHLRAEDEAGGGRQVENGIDVTGGAAAALGEDVTVGDLAQVQRVQDQEVSLVDLIHRSSGGMLARPER